MRKLKITSLSVGDWVCDKNGNSAKILGIENWSDGCMLNIRRCGVDVGMVPLASAHPIPITPEILEKNGFEEYNGIWHLPNSYIEFYRNKDSWGRTVNCGEYVIYSIKYVHELQHALRLEGVEKEIEL